MSNRPRVDMVTATYERSGRCDVCTKKVTRTRNFKAFTLEGAEEQAAAWEKEPLRHRGCSRSLPPSVRERSIEVVDLPEGGL